MTADQGSRDLLDMVVDWAGLLLLLIAWSSFVLAPAGIIVLGITQPLPGIRITLIGLAILIIQAVIVGWIMWWMAKGVIHRRKKRLLGLSVGFCLAATGLMFLAYLVNLSTGPPRPIDPRDPWVKMALPVMEWIIEHVAPLLELMFDRVPLPRDQYPGMVPSIRPEHLKPDLQPLILQIVLIAMGYLFLGLVLFLGFLNVRREERSWEGY